MPVCLIARYQVRPESVDVHIGAVRDLLGAVARGEPGTIAYAAWQEARDPTRFLHAVVFADGAARAAHANSEAVRRFTGILNTNTMTPVEFTEYVPVAQDTVEPSPRRAARKPRARAAQARPRSS